ncbi:hypothetical protein ACSX1A_05075 [Pontibacter sp. MBLB2868]|uniref:hypothetical protein n=1 Tax=Pontibacter sp. MBLB2868 TaxID=3451555 RepID=UPI003F7518B1
MMTPESSFLVLSILKPQKLIFTKILRPVNHEEYKSAMLEVYGKLQQFGLEYWVMDSTSSNFTMLDQKWSVEHLGLLLQDTKIRKVAMVRDRDAILQVIAESMRAKVYRIFGKDKELEHFETLEEALHYLVPGTDAGLLVAEIEHNKSDQP